MLKFIYNAVGLNVTTIISTFVLATIVILISSYKQVLWEFMAKLVSKFQHGEKIKERNSENNQSNTKMTEKEYLASVGYTSERLDEIARCAAILQNYSPANTMESGVTDEEQKLETSLSDLRKRNAMFDADSVNDCDSMIVNVPTEEEQADVDIADLTPDDITISDETGDEEENEGHISPQARADIEAELLESSILNESLEEPDVVEGGKDGDHVDENLIYQSIEDEVIQSFRKTLVRALLESCDGLEIISSDEVFPEQAETSVSSFSGSRLEFTSGDASPSKTDGVTQGKATTADYCEQNDNQRKCVFGDFSDESCLEEGFGDASMKRSYESEAGLGERFPVKAEESQKCDKKKVEVAGELAAGDNVAMVFEYDPKEESNPFASKKDCMKQSTSKEFEGSPNTSRDSSHKFQIRFGDLADSEFETSDEFSEDDLSLLQELIASHVTTRSVLEAIEEISQEQSADSTSNAFLDKVKLDKISKIHSEKKRLSEEELEEERRAQQSQLSQILSLMEQNPQMFGSVTKESLSEQANLYCI